MRTSPARLAKLTRPRLHSPIARERLFAAIDGLRSRPGVWIHGPAGAGKTTLAATYLEACGAPAIWYQVDAGDDAPTFFYYLRQAAEPFSRGRKPLPLLTPEYSGDVISYARRFVRELFARMPPGAIVVLDNFHEAVAHPQMHECIAAAMEEVPEGSTLMVVSRNRPPPAMARADLLQLIGHIGWTELKLTGEETGLIVQNHGAIDPGAVAQLHERCDGWAAAVTLMSEQLRQHGTAEPRQFPELREAAFDYIASQVFDPEPDATRHVLMSIAFLRRVTAATAAAISADSSAGRILEQLYRRRLFIYKQAGDTPSYQLHALFQEFLVQRAREHLSPGQIRDTRLSAADLLAENGFKEEALQLRIDLQDWARARHLLIRLAPELLAAGRWQTLESYIGAFPPELGERDATIGYWHGRALMHANPVAGSRVLAEAYERFAGDEPAQLLCAVSIIEAIHFHFDDFRQLDPWLERVGDMLARGVRPGALEDQIRANAAVMMASVIRAPRLAVVHPAVQQCVHFLSQPIQPNLKLWLAHGLMNYAYLALDSAVEAAAAQAADSVLHSISLTPQALAMYLGARSYTHYLHGRYAAAMPLNERALELDRECGFSHMAENHVLQRGLLERRCGDLAAAEKTIRELRPLSGSLLPHRAAMLAFLEGTVAFDHGRKSEGLRQMLEASDYFNRAGEFNGTLLVDLVSAGVAIECREWGTGQRLLDRLERLIADSVAEHCVGIIHLNRAWLAWRQGDRETAERWLRQAIVELRDPRARIRCRWHQDALSEMLPLALAWHIEPDLVRELARELDIVPSTPLAGDIWPWPIRIHTLGRFELLIDGTAAVFGRKTPKKVLALLKAIVGYGAQNVPEERLIDALWPDEEGDAAHRAFNTALYRLRKLVRHGSFIVQKGGQVTLDGRGCWIDAIAFERAMSDAEANAVAGALALHRGPFLPEETDCSWLAPMRERLHGKFVHGVRTLAEAAERAGRTAEAIAWYTRGLEADELIEAFYQGLMRCHARGGHLSEVAAVYRRMRTCLARDLNVSPSALSDRIYQQSLHPPSPGTSAAA
jgi:ATP/maltotriose-dependent transcriptional regulator MalT/DNA-binding SARP family transcriptional activator